MRSLPGRLVLLGHPVQHSLSPVMQAEALRVAGIPLRYDALDVEPHDLDRVLAELKATNAAGNVTIPFKERVADRCDWLQPAAVATGAVNTFWHADGRLIGDNTDVAGFERFAQCVLGPPPDRPCILLLGAGGGAAAVLEVVRRWSVDRLWICARTPSRAERLASRAGEGMNMMVVTEPNEAAATATLVIHATPVGLSDDTMPLDVHVLPHDAAVMDLAYRPGKTALVRAALQRGLRADDGLAMLIAQGAAAFKRWFGVAADENAMRRALHL